MMMRWIPLPVKELILKPRIIQIIYFSYRHYRTDCYVISYPKSGRTWLRAMLAKSLALYFGDPRGVVFEPAAVVRTGMHKGPIIRFGHDGSDRSPEMEAKLAKRRQRRFRHKKVILLVRDPRDVIVSYYFHRTRRMGETHTLSEFIRHPWWGADRVIAFMKGWYEHRHLPADLLLIRYEDLHQDAAAKLREALAFVNLYDVSDEVIKSAVDYASFESMRKLSLGKLEDEIKLAPTDPEDSNSFKVRRGEVEGYVEYLSPADIEYIEERMRCELPSFFGYRPSRA